MGPSGSGGPATESAVEHPLAAIHRRLGARFVRLPEGLEVPAGYGPVEEEIATLRERCGLVDRSWVSRLALAGEDRQRFLHGLVTFEVKALAPGAGVYGFFTEVKGHVLSDVVVRALEDRLWLELPPGRSPFIAEHLAKYRVADRVEIEPLDEVLPLTLLGPGAPGLLARLAPGADLPAGPWEHRRLDLLGESLVVSADGRWPVAARTLWAPVGAAGPLCRKLLEEGGGEVAPVGHEAVDRLRLAAGIPWFGRDFGPENLPQETGIEEGVSYEKGCYLGQEVVARLHYRGQAGRLLRGLRLDGDRAPGRGAEVRFEERVAGEVTGATLPPGAGTAVAIALLQRRAAEPGTRVEVEGAGEAEVAALPFGP